MGQAVYMGRRMLRFEQEAFEITREQTGGSKEVRKLVSTKAEDTERLSLALAL